MVPRTFPLAARGLSAVALAAVLALTAAPAVRGQDAKTKTSADVVPADAAFYVGGMRMQQQIDILYKSNAYKALRELPVIKEAHAKLMAELKKGEATKGIDPFEVYKQIVADPDNKELVEVILDAGSEDVFVWGGKAWGDMLKLMADVSNAQQFSPLNAVLAGNPGGAEKAQMHAVLAALKKGKESLVVPDVVFGFKVKDGKKAAKQVDRLQAVASKLLEKVEPLKGKFVKKKVAGADFAVLELDGKLVPWDDTPIKNFEEQKDEFVDLVKHLKGMTLSVSIGVKDGYLLVGLTSSTKEIEKFGGKGLSSLPEFAPVVKHADKAITGISFGSKGLTDGYYESSRKQIRETAKTLKELLAKGGEVVKEERRKAIEKDIDAYAAKLEASIKSPGSAVSFSFLTETGYEGYDVNFGDHKALEGVKTQLLDHLGGDPIFAAAVGFTADGKAYGEFSEFVKKVYGHAQAIAKENLPNQEAKDQFDKVEKALLPVLTRIDKVIAKELIPSMKQGGLGLVLDGGWLSKQWVKELPALPKEMPMLELGLLVGVSDGKAFESSLKNLRTALNDLWAAGRESVPNGDNIPEVKIIAPESEKVAGGSLLYYPIPEDIGLDKQFFPCVGLGKGVSALALSKAHATRLIGASKLKMASKPLAHKGDLIGGCYFNWVKLIDKAEPWLEFGMRTGLAEIGREGKGDKKPKLDIDDLIKQSKTALGILRCFKGSTSATYLEDGKLVTHTEIVVKDLPAK